MRKALLKKLWESLISVLPVAVIVAVLSFTPLVELTELELLVFLVSACFLVLGIGLFNLGADLAMTPMGEHTGEGLAKSHRVGVLLSAAFVMGLFITVAEPDLSVLAGQVSAVMDGTLLIFTVGAGVGVFLLIAVLKILFKKDLSSLLLFFYLLLFALAAVLLEAGKGDFLPMAFDSGGVTTGPITVPFIMALGVGIAMSIGGRDARENSFGLIALCSVGPVLAVLLLSVFSTGDLSYALPDYSLESHLGAALGATLLETMGDVAKSLGLIAAVFLILQFTVLRLPGRKLLQILVGAVYTFVGLVIFLTAVTVGFMPVGFRLGQQLAASSEQTLVILGFVIGMVVVLAEPAVHVLNLQVEDITAGEVTKTQMMVALCLGVGLSIALSLLRIILGFSLLYYLIPGYILSLGLSFFVPKLYTAIAFDSGGVASGPLTSSFILPLAIGACTTLRGTEGVLSMAFGVVSMVAMTPLITIQALGFRSVLSSRMRKARAMRRILSADDEQIIYFE